MRLSDFGCGEGFKVIVGAILQLEFGAQLKFDPSVGLRVEPLLTTSRPTLAPCSESVAAAPKNELQAQQQSLLHHRLGHQG